VTTLETTFHSALAPWLRDFVAEKRALGCRYVTELALLRRLDRHLLACAHRDAALPREVLASWLARRPHETAKTQAARIGVARQLAGFLARHRVPVEVPPVPTRAPGRARFVAHVFTHEEVARLLAAADRLRPAAEAPQRHLVVPVLFRVLYACGLRLGEALRLRIRDVDLTAGVLTIRQSKFRKDRLVPLAPSLRARLETYHHATGARPPEAVFFPAPHGGCYTPRGSYAVFRRLLRDAKIPHGGRGRGPRVHDLRHTFAVHRLEAWYREGADLGTKLPVLATYLGHQSLVGTQCYLQLTASLWPDLAAALEQRFGALIPRGTPS
jgi:integrase/recombinase XerD